MIKEYINKTLTFKESFFTYFFILMVYIFPLINNNIPFRDDTVRILRGNGWETLGRGGADILMHSLSFSFGFLTNISPLSFLLSIIILSFSFSFFMSKTELKKDLFNHIALSFIVLFPFYLQNWSYQYDNLTMATGISLVLLSFSLVLDKTINCLYSLILLLLAISFFQPVCQIFIALVFINVLLKIKKSEKSLYDGMIKGIIIYGIALISYFLSLKYIFGGVSTNRAKLVPLNELEDAVFNAFGILGRFFEGFIYTPFFIFMSISCLIFFITLIINVVKEKSSLFDKILKLLTPFILILCIWGPFILLDETFARPRVFLVVNLLIAFIFLYNLNKEPKLLRINKVLTGIIFLFFISTSYQYANLNKYEYDYNKMLTEWVSKDINSNKELSSKNLVYLNSHPDFSPASKMILETMPFLKFIQLPYYNWVSRYYLEDRGVKNVYKDLTNIDNPYDWNDICKNNKAKLVIENTYYNIYIIDNPSLPENTRKHVSVWFKRNANLCKDRANIEFKRNLFFYE